MRLKFLAPFAVFMGFALLAYFFTSIAVIKNFIFMENELREGFFTNESVWHFFVLLFKVINVPEIIISIIFCIIFFMIASFFYLRFLYIIWSIIPPNLARTTPSRAIWFLFIPVLNVVWLFIVHWGWALDYNALLKQRNIKTAPLSEALFLAYTIIFLCVFIPDFGISLRVVAYIFSLIIMTRICYAIDILNDILPEPVGVQIKMNK